MAKGKVFRGEVFRERHAFRLSRGAFMRPKSPAARSKRRRAEIARRRGLALEVLEDRTLLSGLAGPDLGNALTLESKANTQIVTPSITSQKVAPGEAFSFDVDYNTSTGDETLTGMGLRLHYDSSLLSFNEVTNLLTASLFQSPPYTPANDSSNLDGDVSTDKYVMVPWVSMGGRWPNRPLPLRLYTATFTVLQAAPSSTFLRFSASTAAGYTLAYTPVAISFPQVVARSIFYNQSAFDGNDPAANAADDEAIATDKTALLPGQQATGENYTSYSRGINGLMIDLDLAVPGADAANFQFRVGNGDTPGTWTALAATPAVSLRHDVGGVDRVTLVWPDHAIQDTWLEVTVLGSLATPDVFYFGNMRGETGDSTANTVVDTGDFLATRSRARDASAAPITDPGDHDRNGSVDAADCSVVRANLVPAGRALRLVKPFAGAKDFPAALGADLPALAVEPAPSTRNPELLATLARAALDDLFAEDEDWLLPLE